MKKTQRKYYSWLFSLLAVSAGYCLTIIYPAAQSNFGVFVSSIGGLLTILHASNVTQKVLTKVDDSVPEEKK